MLQIEFSSAQKSSQLNGFFNSAEKKGLMEGKDYAAIDTSSPFISALIDRVTGYGDNPAVTTVHL